jgi:integrase/recombinase XerD
VWTAIAIFRSLKDYQTYLRVEKGLRPLTCEAYDGDLKTFAEFIEGRHGVLA